MISVKGKFNEAIVYTSNVEEKALEQIRNVCDLEIFRDSRIRIMPDVHAGAGCTIGTTMTLHGAAVPNMVGVDIGCGMETCRIKEKEIDFAKLDALIRREIPSGRNVRSTLHPFAGELDLKELRIISDEKQLNKEKLAIGTLGGGNHFIEADRDEQENLYIVIHSGSRHLGKTVAELYQEKACRQLYDTSEEEISALIERYRREGREKEIESALVQLKKGKNTDIPRELAYCQGSVYEDYLHDMKIMQEYAMINRKAMMQVILEGMGLHEEETFTTIHNYIDTENGILRKGSVSAQKGEKLLIPINMRDGSLICIGKGNPEWNYSAPHGAGRLFSRGEARRRYSLEEFEKQMEGIYTTSVHYQTLDECPMAYKGMDEIMENITPTAEIVEIIRPVYNFKADN